MTKADSPIRTNCLYAYALLVPGRQPFYLPSTMKPENIGSTRNVELDQSPGSEETFVVGDGARKVEPLRLSGAIFAANFKTRTEDAARLWLQDVERAVRTCTKVQRGQSVYRDVHPVGYMQANPGRTPLEWTLTLHLFPTGPSWRQVGGDQETPF
ncbi:MAG: hypothetical protein Q4C67_05595 [Deinococcus sp.]|nr:hypothetical protein [Deinococcus sp.]